MSDKLKFNKEQLQRCNDIFYGAFKNEGICETPKAGRLINEPFIIYGIHFSDRIKVGSKVIDAYLALAGKQAAHAIATYKTIGITAKYIDWWFVVSQSLDLPVNRIRWGFEFEIVECKQDV
jgi:hypothetical protein